MASLLGRGARVWGQTSILERVAWRGIRRSKEDWLWNGVKLVGWVWRTSPDGIVDIKHV